MSRLQSEEFLLLLPPTSLLLCYSRLGCAWIQTTAFTIHYIPALLEEGSLEGHQLQMFSILLTYYQEKQVFLWVLFCFFCFLKKFFLGGHHVSLAILLINLKKSEPGGKKKHNTRFDFTMSLSFSEPKLGTHWMKRICFYIAFFLKNKRWFLKSVTSFNTFDNFSNSDKVQVSWRVFLMF